MKILLVTPHFYPESFKCNDIAFEMKKRGHDVTVFTAIPDYPEGKFHAGYGIFKRRNETVNGVKVDRSIIIPRGNGGSIRLGLNYLSYTLFSSLAALTKSFKRKYDVVIVHETSPVMTGIPAAIVSKFQKIPMIFWVLDLWPESLEIAGNIHNKQILKPFESLTKWLYKKSNKILISSRGFEKSICAKGNFKNKIEFFPNWVEVSLKNTPDVQSVPVLPAGFNVMIAGNMGEAQSIPHILESAKLLKNSGINIIFVGDGRKRNWAEDYVKEHKLNSVFFLGRFPIEAMPSLFRQTDILMFALTDNKIFELTVPARLQAYMSAGKPVVAMINGEGAEVIKEADCGWSVPAEKPRELADLLLELRDMPPSLLNQRGINGKEYAERHYDLNTCMDHLEKIMAETLKS